jgi:hypothetical protein
MRTAPPTNGIKLSTISAVGTSQSALLEVLVLFLIGTEAVDCVVVIRSFLLFIVLFL